MIAGYAAIRGEIDVLPALAALASLGHDTALPEIEEGRLVFRRWRPGDTIAKGCYGIDVPLSSALTVTPHVVIVPLLAFDGRGTRLGYGAGYYDRALRRLRRADRVLALGAAYAMQEMPQLPCDERDEPLDAIATENGVRWFGTQTE